MSAGTTGANRLTTGVPTAAARCAAPVFGATTTSACARTEASMGRLVWPHRFTTRPRGSGAGPAKVRSAAEPVTTTRCPAAARAPIIAAVRSADGCRAGTEAPGCTTT